MNTKNKTYIKKYIQTNVTSFNVRNTKHNYNLLQLNESKTLSYTLRLKKYYK